MTIEEWFFDPSLADTGGVGTRMTITLAGATFTNGTWNLNETGAFSGYTFHAGDRIHISGGTAVTAGYYEIASKTDADNIVLTGDITTDASSPTDVTSASRPYGNLNDGVKKITFGAEGARINILAGTTATLTESLYTSMVDTGTTAAWAPAAARNCYVQGYTTIPADGGRATIDGDGTYGVMSTALDFTHFRDLRLTNTGSADVLKLKNSSQSTRCEIDNSTGNGVSMTGNSTAVSYLEIHNIGGVGFTGSNYGSIYSSYIYNDGANEMTWAIYGGVAASHNIISVSGATNGIWTGAAGYIMHNSVYASPGSTGYGVGALNQANSDGIIANNLVEGFDINFPITGSAANVGPFFFFGNFSYNAVTSDFDHSVSSLNGDIDYWNAGNLLENTNFTLTASPFVNAANGNFMPTALVKEMALPHNFANGQAI